MNGQPSGGMDAKSLVLQATDIVELIGQTVKLKRSGAKYLGLCPFHQEKTPSFNVNPAKQFFKCFGCGKGGNAIDFIIERDRVDFREALRSLAQRANIELPSFGQTKQKASERQVLLEAHSAACAFFEKSLQSPEGKAARDYLAQRGFTPESIQRFQIGFAPNAWDGLLRSPVLKKFSPQELALGGLLKPRENGSGHYDTFRNRIIFPIRDEGGRIIAFGGRVAPGSDDRAKYLNSPETPLFSKSRCAFGIDLARPRIVETRTVAVVEGYTDVVMAHQFGVSNVVSVLGTALTEQHVALLRRFADRIVLLFDADTAGDVAADRAIEILLTQPVEIAIASMPQGMDPDEYLLAHGPEGFDKLLAEAPDALSYKWKQLDQKWRSTGDLTAQQQAVQTYLDTLAKARGTGTVDQLRWGLALQRVSRLTEISVDDLNRRFRIKPAGAANRPQPRNNPSPVVQVADRGEPNNTARSPARASTARDKAEGAILGVLLAEPGRWVTVQQHLAPVDFTDPLRRRLAEVYWQYQQDEGEPVFNEFLSQLDPELKDLAIRWFDEADASPDLNATLQGAMDHLGEERRREEERKLIAQLRRTTGGEPALSTGLQNPASPDGSKSETSGDEAIEVLRRLQEKARKPDLRRLGA